MKHKNIYTLIVLFFITSFISCNKKEKKEVEAEFLNSYIESLNLSPTYHWIVILPGLGCHGCIQEGEEFMKQYVQNKSIFFILTSVESIKLLQNKTGMKVNAHSNVYVDKENKIDIPSDNKIYPCIIQVEKGEYRTHEFQSPSSSQAFSKLKVKLDIDR